MGRNKKKLQLVLGAITMCLLIGWGGYYFSNHSRYQEAKELGARGASDEAQYMFRALEGFSDSAALELACVRQRLQTAKVGDRFKLGLCVQRGQDEKLPIEWQILRVQEKRVTAIATLGLYSLPYNTELQSTDWERCTLRQWLNQDFYNESFTAAEQSLIAETLVENPDNAEFKVPGGPATRDKIYLLSLDEVQRYLPTPEQRLAQASEYAMDHGGRSNLVNAYIWWWLRSPGSESNCASRVCVDGTIDDLGVHNFNVCVRPVLEIAY